MIRIILDGQFGSCGKGAVVSVLSRLEKPDTVVRMGGPQAGHSMKDLDGNTHVMRQIPCAWHTGPRLVIGRGAIIDPQILEREIELIGEACGRLLVDTDAFMLEERHRAAESVESFGEAGSTREGVGAVRMQMAMRTADRIGDLGMGNPPEWLTPFLWEDTSDTLRELLADGKDVWIEATQGFGLSLTASGFYPFVTSTDITPQRLLADAGLHWGDAEVKTTMLLRTFPIRIEGNSGPLDEMDWNELPIPPAHIEITSVTKRPRRIGRFNWHQVDHAIIECRPTELIITFLDYLKKEDRLPFIRQIERRWGIPVVWGSVGFEELVRRDQFEQGLDL